jgi:hypothetical protein
MRQIIRLLCEVNFITHKLREWGVKCCYPRALLTTRTALGVVIRFGVEMYKYLALL